MRRPKQSGKEEPSLPDRVGSFALASLVGALLTLAALVAAIYRAGEEGWPNMLILLVVFLALLLLLLLQVWRILRAWQREVLAERDARRDREQR